MPGAADRQSSRQKIASAPQGKRYTLTHNIHTHTHTHTYIHIYMCVYIYTHTYIYMYIYIHMYRDKAATLRPAVAAREKQV